MLTYYQQKPFLQDGLVKLVIFLVNTRNGRKVNKLVLQTSMIYIKDKYRIYIQLIQLYLY